MRVIRIIVTLIILTVITGCTKVNIEVISRTTDPKVFYSTKKPVKTPFDEPEPTVIPGIPLSQRELDDFFRFLTDVENRGFLLCLYDTHRDIDLQTVLQEGAGIKSEIDSKEMAFLKVQGFSNDYRPVMKIKKSDIITFMKDKTGMPFVKNKHMSF